MNAIQVGDIVNGVEEFSTSKGMETVVYTGEVTRVNNGLARIRITEPLQSFYSNTGDYVVEFTYRLKVVKRA